MRRNHQRGSRILCVVLLAALLCGCGKEKESPYKGLAFEVTDFRQVNFGTTIDVVKSFENVEPVGEYDASNIEELGAVDADTLKVAKQYRMRVLCYDNVPVGDRNASILYFFVKEKLALAVLGYEDQDHAAEIFEDMKAYYTELLGAPTATKTDYCQYTKGNKYLMVVCDRDSGVAGITVMDLTYMQ